jgi:energy-coupling factor transport system permease protein
MATRAPILFTERDTPIHRLDPRVKLVLFAFLIAFLFVAPGWEWLAGMTLLGLGLVALARVPVKWLLVLCLIQLPNVLALLLIPALGPLFGGEGLKLEDFEDGLHLAFAWIGAVFISVGIFSTMQADDITDGMRALGLPLAFCFAVGLSYRLLYATLNDVIRITEAMKLKGVDLETRNPLRFAAGAVKLFLPVLFAIVRRGPTTMAVLAMRGYAGSRRHERLARAALHRADASCVVGGLFAVGLAAATRFGGKTPAEWAGQVLGSIATTLPV